MSREPDPQQERRKNIIKMVSDIREHQDSGLAKKITDLLDLMLMDYQDDLLTVPPEKLLLKQGAARQLQRLSAAIHNGCSDVPKI